ISFFVFGHFVLRIIGGVLASVRRWALLATSALSRLNSVERTQVGNTHNGDVSFPIIVLLRHIREFSSYAGIAAIVS
ncbi:MAG: hypothetical protein RR084_07970, partial [Bacteroidales bacterium]